MTISDFRSKSLSDKIILALIEATQAYTEMDTMLREYPSVKLPLSDILLSLEIYYSHYDINPEICQIVHSLYIYNNSIAIVGTARTITACIEYAQNKAKKTDILTAGDLIKINEAIKIASIAPLSEDEYLQNMEQHIKTIWPILHDLYGPQRQYTLFLEIAIAYYRLITLSEYCLLDLRTIAILLSTIRATAYET